MLTTKDFTERYKTSSDEELYSIYKSADSYGENALEALHNVIKEKGGIDALEKRLEAKALIENEKRRIAAEAVKMVQGGVDAQFIKNTTSSAILSQQEVDAIVEENAAKAAMQVNDKKVDSDTIVKSMAGAALAAVAGGILTAAQFIYFGATSVLMIVATAIVCYVVVKLVTKKSYNNTAVLLASFAAFVISYLIGYLALLIFGYQG